MPAQALEPSNSSASEASSNTIARDSTGECQGRQRVPRKTAQQFKVPVDTQPIPMPQQRIHSIARSTEAELARQPLRRTSWIRQQNRPSGDKRMPQPHRKHPEVIHQPQLTTQSICARNANLNLGQKGLLGCSAGSALWNYPNQASRYTGMREDWPNVEFRQTMHRPTVDSGGNPARYIPSEETTEYTNAAL